MRAAHVVLDVPAPRAVRAPRDIAAQERAARVTSSDRRHAAVYTLVTLYALYNSVTGSDLSCLGDFTQTPAWLSRIDMYSLTRKIKPTAILRTKMELIFSMQFTLSNLYHANMAPQNMFFFLVML